MNEKEHLNTDTEKNLGKHQRKYKETLMVINQSNLTILLSLSPFPLSRNPVGDKLSLQLTLLKSSSILITSKVLLFTTGNSAHCYVAAWMGGEFEKEEYIFVPDGSDSKESTCNAGDPGSIPESRRFPGEGHGNPLQYSCLENSMDRGAWQTTVHALQRVRHD